MVKSIYIILLITFGLNVCTRGQTMVVRSLEADPTDISASTQKRMAPDGRPCGLLKVQMADRLLRLDGDMNVGNLSQTGSLTWVYLPSGTYGVSLVTEHHGTIDVNFSDYGIDSMESLHTYLITLVEAFPDDPDNPTDPNAQYELGKDYKMPRNGKLRDEVKAMEWFQKAAEQGLAEAQLEMGHYYIAKHEDTDSTVIISWLDKAARQGLADAQYELANYSFELWAWLPDDASKATSPFLKMYHYWLPKAAEQDHVKAMERLGKFYIDEVYTEDDIQERMKWNERASNKGSAEAAYNQGLIYEYCYKDRQKAKEWYQKASRRSHEKASEKLQTIYFK